MSLKESIYQKARDLQKTILLPEALDERTLKAAQRCAEEGFGPVILLGPADAIEQKAKEVGADISKAQVIDPSASPDLEDYIGKLTELRAHKGMTEEKARGLLSDPAESLYFAAMMVKMEKADGYVSGAVHSTGDTIRPALQIIKTAEGCKTISSFFIMSLPETSPYYTTRKVLFYSDAGVVEQPTKEQIADIAIQTAKSMRSLMPGEEPRVALLSYSTKGSASSSDTQKMIDALAIIKERAPDLCVDGEMQGDAALIEAVGAKKAPGSPVAGKANILIFPDLGAGNIAYKLTERLAGAQAVGPLLQGMAKPVNDLSRGCGIEDIVYAVAVTACQNDA